MGLCVLAVGVVGWWIVVPIASAQTPAECPTAPADYTGTDQTLDELRDQRIDAAASCSAIVDQLTDAIAAAGDTAHADSLAARAHYDELHVELEQLHTDLTAEDPATTQEVALSATDRQQFNERNDELGYALLFVAGAIAAAGFALGMWRVIR